MIFLRHRRTSRTKDAHTCVAGGANFGLWQAALVIYGIAKVADFDKRVSARHNTLQEGIFQFDVPAKVPDILQMTSSQAGKADTKRDSCGINI